MSLKTLKNMEIDEYKSRIDVVANRIEQTKNKVKRNKLRFRANVGTLRYALRLLEKHSIALELRVNQAIEEQGVKP